MKYVTVAYCSIDKTLPRLKYYCMTLSILKLCLKTHLRTDGHAPGPSMEAPGLPQLRTFPQNEKLYIEPWCRLRYLPSRSSVGFLVKIPALAFCFIVSANSLL